MHCSPINKYVFDYKLVAKEDPTFEKFITREKYSQGLLSDMYEDVIQSEKEEVTTTGKAEEDEIINFVHDKDKDRAQDACRQDWNRTSIEIMDSNQGQSLHSTPPTDRVYLKEEYRDPPNPDYNPNILQLPPPNRFLKGRSKIWSDENTLYSFDPGPEMGHHDFVNIVHRYRFSHNPPFIRLQEALYWFDRSINAMVEKKTKVRLLIYNTKSRQLYLIRKVRTNPLKKGCRLRSIIFNVSNTIFANKYNMVNPPKRLLDRFVDTITQAVVKDIGEVNTCSINPYQPAGNERQPYKHETRVTELTAVILQHRVGQPIQWLNYLLAINIFHFIGNIQAQEQFLSFLNHRSLREARKIRKKTTLKLVPNLRKSNHMKTAIKTLFAEDYSKLLVKLFNMRLLANDGFLISWVCCTRQGLISKELYHWIAQTVKTNNHTLLNDVITVITPILRHWQYNSDQNSIEEDLASKSYIKICKKWIHKDLIDSDGIPNWHTWLDMYRMAGQLHIRIRPNKLRSATEVIEIHDRMSTIIGRDEHILEEYKNVVFKEFTCPDEKYDGFQFIQLRTAEELREEGTIMHHCVASYTSRCFEGGSIIFSMRRNGKSYVTIELNPHTYEVVQQYTLHDITVTNEKVISMINKWQSDCLKIHKKEEQSYHDICQERIEKIRLIRRLKRLCEIRKGGVTGNA